MANLDVQISFFVNLEVFVLSDAHPLSLTPSHSHSHPHSLSPTLTLILTLTHAHTHSLTTTATVTTIPTWITTITSLDHASRSLDFLLLDLTHTVWDLLPG